VTAVVSTTRRRLATWAARTAKASQPTASAYRVARRALRGSAVGASPPLAPLQRRPAVHVQICAHADDDLYFMNPDVHQAIRAGDEVVTVYLTSGEADGRNTSKDEPGGEENGVGEGDGHEDGDQAVPVDYAGYSAARMNGIRAAYGFMTTGNREAAWQREALALPHGAQAELATLRDDPRVRLVFLSLGAGPHDDSPARRLCHLWTGRNTTQPTLTPTGSPMGGPYEYTRDQVVEAIAELYRRLRPTVVRTLDPDPERLSVREDGHVEYSDHADHTAAAYFAYEALETYRNERADPVAVVSYRGYYNRHWPLNLNADTYRRKAAVLDVYGGADPHKCDDPANCGDLKVGGDARSRRYGRSTLSRYPESTAWLQRQGDGRLAAFAVLGGVPVVWTETVPGAGSWTGPRPLGVSRLVPDLSVLAYPDGRLRLFGIRMHLFANYSRQRREIVTAVQAEPGGPFGEWIGLGNPHQGRDWYRNHEIGMPAAEVNADGRAQLFVRNFGMGVSSRTESGGGAGSGGEGGEGGGGGGGESWGRWQDLGGSRLQGPLDAVRTDSGLIELYANTADGVQRWRQAEPNGSFKIDYGFDAGQPSGRVTVAKDVAGRLALFYRAAERETVRAYRQLKADGEWAAEPVDLPGHGGTGSVAATSADASGSAGGSSARGESGRSGESSSDRTAGFVLATRNRDGAISVTRTRADGTGARWTASGGLAMGAPSMARDAAGHLVLAAIGPDCRLYLAYQESEGRRDQGPDATGAGFGPWRPAP